MKKTFTAGSLVFLLLQQSTVMVFAQESTDSSTLVSPTTTPKYSIATASAGLINTTDISPAVENPFTENSSSTVTSSSNLLDQALSSTQSQFSAAVKQSPVVGKLAKHTFRRDEKVSVTVGNQQAGDISVALYDADNKNVTPQVIEETTIGSQTLVSIDPAQFAFRPGKYTVKITDSTGATTTQDFTWGVLALNTNKSYYLSNENADIAIAVLDEKGTQVCNATVALDITSPSGTITHLSTDDNTIMTNTQCMSHAMSLIPDYQTHFVTSEQGDYDMTLTATTANGANSIHEPLQVVSSVPFDVERVSTTRVFPANTYPMIFHVTANQDFSGTLVETVPANFTISPYASQSAQTYTDTTLVMPLPNAQAEFGVASLALAMPFVGSSKMVQGFGVALTDPEEKAYYQEFGLAGHDGLDFAMPSGRKVLATDDGVVSLSGDGAYGTTIVIVHPWGKSYYGHLRASQVVVGQHVTKGEVIGLSGATGHVTGPHLHFGIKPLHANMQNGFYGKVDPTPYLAAFSQNTGVLGVTTSAVGSSQRLISWNVSLKKGDSATLAYGYQTPAQSPAFFDIGPLQFIDKGTNKVFQESRQWELAIDANSTATGNCQTAVNDASIGGQAWGTPSNGCSAPVSSITTSTPAFLTTTTASNYLKATNFGFALPTNAKIIGIQFGINHWSASNGSARGTDNAVRSVKNNVIDSGNDHASASNYPTSSGTWATYGSTSDLWGNTWLYSDINASNFGVALSSKGTSSSKAITGNVTSTTTTPGFTATITYNAPPNAPTGLNASSISSTSESLQMSATDPESDALEYKAVVYPTNTDCTNGTNAVVTYDQTSSQTGWDNTSYTSGATATLTTTGLTASTTYYWKAQSIDTAGSNAFGTASSCSSFTTVSAPIGPTLDQLLKHGEWFSSGVEQPFTF